ncbi:type I restriction-modification system subunit M [Ruminococcus difficilis]|uniref:site-specific DNA-methyltransferase (adenine-specific) n=1 Tax=Ruminococcus difficilis TaxID=2763069 RepID=A0A934WRL0_9FIRM|nr:class I SAM-dependent DNA methyltransferase [Ruminococcus difficilis]MBK6088295.1 N-6 DNA methylase [Ruminococcus difficilis]
MTDKELKKLKDDLWHAADMLRAGAHIAANKYGQPILGLIFLRYADILFKQHHDEIMAEYEKYKGTRMEKDIKSIAVEKCGFFLPECAYYDFINNAPDNAGKAKLVKSAMQAIEDENPKMAGVLPKEVYAQLVPDEEPELLSNIIRIFKDIPENSTIDIFGEIYEYFLGNFALSEGKDGGTFYTPATVVRYMVEVLNPEPGDKKILDPACGSGGMFVQAARYMHRHNATEADQMKFRCYGIEKEPDTVKLAKMNLLLNNVRGEITEANTFYSDPYNTVGNFDYVMANPPFNVDEVVYSRVIEDERYSTYGVPRNKTKKGGKKDSDKKETVPNANYLWIGLFASALNKNGKAALVMANSASDAGKSEYEIRRKLIEEGVISQMVTLPSNMFTSVTLPATLWFFDKHKPQTDKKDEILFIDARNIFTQVDRAHRKFSDEQIKNLGIITRLYEGDTEAFNALIKEYKTALAEAPETAEDKDTKTKAYWQEQIDWLIERFPEGKYQDVTGLCKAAKVGISYEIDKKGKQIEVIEEDSIADQDYSLNAGRYVGVVIEDDGMTEEEFKATMLNLNEEFKLLNKEAQNLELEITKNIRDLFENE